MIETKNAIIKSASLSTADHGCLSSFLHLDYGDSSGQGFGGYALYSPDYPNAGAGLWIWRILEVIGVSEWKNIVGKSIRVRAEYGKVHAIGHFIEDKWFEPKMEFETLERAREQKA